MDSFVNQDGGMSELDSFLKSRFVPSAYPFAGYVPMDYAHPYEGDVWTETPYAHFIYWAANYAREFTLSNIPTGYDWLVPTSMAERSWRFDNGRVGLTFNEGYLFSNMCLYVPSTESPFVTALHAALYVSKDNIIRRVYPDVMLHIIKHAMDKLGYDPAIPFVLNFISPAQTVTGVELVSQIN